MNPIQVNLLGPLDMRMADRAITPTARKPRQVLALLAIHAGKLVTMHDIIDELWGTRAPGSSVQTVQTYILRLRQGIRAVAPGTDRRLLATRQGGYTLDIAPGDVDVHRFDRFVADGERALTQDQAETASRLLGCALDSWRGPALVDVDAGAKLDVELARLEQSRLCALVSRIDADLRLNRHHQLLGELAELNACYPMHEKLCAQYMTALSLSGMTWRALEVFRSLRRNLVDELGIEPSLPLQHLQRSILKSDVVRDLHSGAMTSFG